MADLVARGPGPQDFWRQSLAPGTVTLGRRPEKSTWSAPWDQQISGLHATLTWRHDQLLVRRDPRAVNPVFYEARDQGFQEFAVAVGEVFVIGETTFAVENSPPPAGAHDPTPDAELTCSRAELREFRYVDADERIEVLAALPEVIRFSPTDEELEHRVVEVLLRGIPRAGAAAVVELVADEGGAEAAVKLRTALTRDRSLGPLNPSCRLLLDAVGRRQSVLYRWGFRQASPQTAEYTVQVGVDWAVCVPLPDDPSPGWGLYVAGRLPGGTSTDLTTPHDLFKGDLKFAELVADVFGALRQVRDLQRRHAQLTRFLSRPVLAELASRDIDDVLRPREADVAVLFCDLRGSCMIGEEGQDDLAGLWGRVSAALEVMTSSITDLDGVIGDFQGDAAMGFWGWPLPAADAVERAARAALNIRRDFARPAPEPGRPLVGFTCGIGIAAGPAFAGKLGTYDQFKVGVFGPVVNLASRLESMTKLFQVPVLLDEPAARGLVGGGPGRWCRCRRVARVRPYGMKAELTVSELLPLEVEPGAMREGDRRNYEAALDAFLAGRWKDAGRLLRLLPPGDGPTRFLQNFMKRHRQTPPADWDGVIPLEAK